MIPFSPGTLVRQVAVDDLKGILSYLAQSSPQRAQSFSEQFTRPVENLIAMPRMGSPREVEGVALPSLRMFPVQNFKQYLIWYQPFATNDGIEVVRVLHHSRDYETHLADEATSSGA